MRRFLLLLALAGLALAGCSQYDYVAVLDSLPPGASASSKVCSCNVREARISGKGSEVLTVNFRDSSEIVSLRPRRTGGSSDAPVPWSLHSHDQGVLYVELTEPEMLSVSAVDKLVGQRICVRFDKPAFERNRDDVRLGALPELKGVTCCGVVRQEPTDKK